MAGSNDLCEGSTAAAVAGCVQALHRACHVEGVATWALTVPPNKFLTKARHERWARANALLRAWYAARSHEGVLGLLEVEQVIPHLAGLLFGLGWALVEGFS